MINKEKDILKKASEHHEGLLSPATMINGIAQRDGKALHSLISSGYIEEVPHNVNDRSYTFYRVSEKGRKFFEPFYSKWWFSIKKDVKTIIIAAITSLVTTAVALLATNLFD